MIVIIWMHQSDKGMQTYQTWALYELEPCSPPCGSGSQCSPLVKGHVFELLRIKDWDSHTLGPLAQNYLRTTIVGDNVLTGAVTEEEEDFISECI